MVPAAVAKTAGGWNFRMVSLWKLQIKWDLRSCTDRQKRRPSFAASQYQKRGWLIREKLQDNRGGITTSQAGAVQIKSEPTIAIRWDIDGSSNGVIEDHTEGILETALIGLVQLRPKSVYKGPYYKMFDHITKCKKLLQKSRPYKRRIGKNVEWTEDRRDLNTARTLLLSNSWCTRTFHLNTKFRWDGLATNYHDPMDGTQIAPMTMLSCRFAKKVWLRAESSMDEWMKLPLKIKVSWRNKQSPISIFYNWGAKTKLGSSVTKVVTFGAKRT